MKPVTEKSTKPRKPSALFEDCGFRKTKRQKTRFREFEEKPCDFRFYTRRDFFFFSFLFFLGKYVENIFIHDLYARVNL